MMLEGICGRKESLLPSYSWSLGPSIAKMLRELQRQQGDRYSLAQLQHVSLGLPAASAKLGYDWKGEWLKCLGPTCASNMDVSAAHRILQTEGKGQTGGLILRCRWEYLTLMLWASLNVRGCRNDDKLQICRGIAL